MTEQEFIEKYADKAKKARSRPVQRLYKEVLGEVQSHTRNYVVGWLEAVTRDYKLFVKKEKDPDSRTAFNRRVRIYSECLKDLK